MRVVIQRVEKANVLIDFDERKSIDNGLVVFLGITENDTEDDIKYLVKKIENIRIFDENDKMNLSVKDINGDIMIISQFTLYANTKNGNRPSFEKSLKYNLAKDIYDKFVDEIKKSNINIVTGKFGSDMKVSLINDGPVTIIIDSKGEI